MKGKQADEKTNVMRVLDSKKIKYNSYCYVDSGAVNGMEVATVLGQNPKQVFKTLVTIGKSNANYVFVIPVCHELDLKKAASAVGEKKLEMLKAKDLLGLTGYVHGGCSPIGMKKLFPTVFDSSAGNFSEIYVSGGRIGLTLKVPVDALLKVTGGKLADITMK